MQTALTYPRVQSVRPLPGKRLFVTFSTGEARIYNCQPLLEEETFRPLADESIFRQAHPDAHGYAVIWSDDIDLAESEIWINGEPTEPNAPGNAG